MQNRTQRELLQKYKGDKSYFDLDFALVQASSNGPSQDVLALIQLGASVNYIDENGNTALHVAILNGKLANILTLIKEGASLYKCDSSNRTPAELALTSPYPEVKSFGKNLHNFLHDEKILDLICPYLTYLEVFHLRLVSNLLAKRRPVLAQHALFGLNEEQKVIFNRLPGPLKHIIAKRLTSDNREVIQRLFTLLAMKDSERKLHCAEIKRLPMGFFCYGNNEANDSLIVMLVLKLLPIELLAEYQMANPDAAYMLDEKIITECDLRQRVPGWSGPPGHNYYTQIMNKRGRLALQLGLIKKDIVLTLPSASSLLCDTEFELLRKRFISSELIVAAYKKNCMFDISNLTRPYAKDLLADADMPPLFSTLDPANVDDVERAIKIARHLELLSATKTRNFIKSGLISLDDFVQLLFHEINGRHLDILEEILKTNLVSIDSLKQFPDLKTLLTPEALHLLKTKLLTIDQARELCDPQIGQPDRVDERKNNFQILCTEAGLQAITDKVITLNDARYHSLAILRLPNAVHALKAGLISLSEAKKFHDYGGIFQSKNLELMLSERGIIALREGLITIDCAAKLREDVLKELLTENGLTALRSKKLTAEQFIPFTSVNSARAILSDNGQTALREGLITMEEAAKFRHGGSSAGPFDNLQGLLTMNGLYALRHKLISPAVALQINCLEQLFDDRNPEALRAIECGAFVLSDFYDGGKRYWYGGDLKQNAKKALMEHVTKDTVRSSPLVDKAELSLNLQSSARGYIARQRFLLFQATNHYLKSSKMDATKLTEVDSIIHDTMSGKYREAQQKLLKLKYR